MLTKHAEAALKAAKKADKNPHVDEGIQHLEGAVAAGKKVMPLAARNTPKRH